MDNLYPARATSKSGYNNTAQYLESSCRIERSSRTESEKSCKSCEKKERAAAACCSKLEEEELQARRAATYQNQTLDGTTPFIKHQLCRRAPVNLNLDSQQ